MEVIVKAALQVDSTSKNTVLQNADTQVMHCMCNTAGPEVGDVIINV